MEIQKTTIQPRTSPVTKPMNSMQRRNEAGDSAIPPSARSNRRSNGRWFKATAIAVVASAIAWSSMSGSINRESDAENWHHVEAATHSQHTMRWVNLQGSVLASNQIVLGVDDEDHSTTTAIREALLRGDLDAADAIFLDAQNIESINVTTEDSRERTTAHRDSSTPARNRNPHYLEGEQSTIAELTTQSPIAQMTPGMRSEMMHGDSKFYHVHLNDSCYNDGDVVEILVNEKPMFLVPINNAGATISIPVSTRSVTVVSVRGVYDGGGGITVACRTSRGEGFIRVMSPGEIQPLGVVLP